MQHFLYSLNLCINWHQIAAIWISKSIISSYTKLFVCITIMWQNVKIILFSIFFTLLFHFLGKTIWMLDDKGQGKLLIWIGIVQHKWLDTGISFLTKLKWQVIEKFCHTLELSNIKCLVQPRCGLGYFQSSVQIMQEVHTC